MSKKGERNEPAFTKKPLDGALEEPAHRPHAERKMTNDRRITEELEQIYANTDGTLPDMRHITRHARKGTAAAFGMLLMSLVFLGGVMWAGFFFFSPSAAFQENDVVLSVSGESEATIGMPVSYRVRYRNNQGVPLSDARLRVAYPAGFVFEKSNRPPSNEEQDEWDMGSIREDESGYIDVMGRLYGTVHTEQSFRAFLTYTPSNFSSEFQKTANAVVSLLPPPIDLSVESQTSAVAGADTTFAVVVRRQKLPNGMILPPLSVSVLPPSHFTKKTSAPASDAREEYRWTLRDGDAESKITVTGVFGAAEGATSTIVRVALLGKKPDDTAGETYSFLEKDISFAMTDRAVVPRIAVNGSMGDGAVAPGDTLHVTVSVENNGKTAIEGVRLRALFDAPSAKDKSILDWAKLEEPFDGDIVGEQLSPSVRRGSITWTQKEIPALRSIAPGEDVDVTLLIPLKTDIDDRLAAATSTILAVVDVQYDAKGKKELLQGNRVEMLLVSDARVAVQEKVVDEGDGKTTRQVTWLLSNSFHDLRDIQLSADVYGDARWNAGALSLPAGSASYDETKKTVVWTVPNMPRSVDVLALQFSVTLERDNPTQKLLMSKVRGRATDAALGREIMLAGPEIALHE